jgi:predicted alpha/beta-hydrolase family hydrolase
MEHRGIAGLAGEFVSRGLHVVRFNFLYTEKKKGPPDRMPRLMECYAAVVERARAEVKPRHVFIGGHSMGGRTASMLAAGGFACDGLILLGYPLHPSGQPEKLRDEHLPRIQAPVLCLNGTRDELCQRELMEEVVRRLPESWTMHWLEGADHGFHVQKRSGRTDEDVVKEIGEVSRAWVERVISP